MFPGNCPPLLTTFCASHSSTKTLLLRFRPSLVYMFAPVLWGNFPEAAAALEFHPLGENWAPGEAEKFMWQCDSSKLRKREVGTFVRQPSVFAPVSMLAACLFLALTCPIPKRNHRKCGPVSHMSSRIMVSGCCPVHQVTCDSLCSGPLQTKRQLFCPKSSTYIRRKCRKRIGKNSKIVVTDP